jgi:hypothetical protein
MYHLATDLSSPAFSFLPAGVKLAGVDEGAFKIVRGTVAIVAILGSTRLNAMNSSAVPTGSGPGPSPSPVLHADVIQEADVRGTVLRESSPSHALPLTRLCPRPAVIPRASLLRRSTYLRIISERQRVRLTGASSRRQLRQLSKLETALFRHRRERSTCK